MSFLISGMSRREGRAEGFSKRKPVPCVPAKLSSWHTGIFCPISGGNRKVTGIEM